MRLICFFCFAWLVCLLFSLLEGAFAAEPDAVDLEVLVAGVKYNDSLLKSGKGHFVIQPTHTEFEKKLLGVLRFETGLRKVFFAYDGKKVRCETRSEVLSDYVAVFDGEKQVDIDKSVTPPSIGVRGSLTIDPRSFFHYWGFYFLGQPVGEYLEKNAIAILGKERINNTPCDIIQAKRPGGTVKFWVAPSKGYRVLKREFETTYQGGVPATVTMVVQYQKLGDIWFPKSGTDTTLALNKTTGKQELLFKYTLTVKDFELNVDVSDLFKIAIPPETIVWDYRTQSKRTAKEAGIK